LLCSQSFVDLDRFVVGLTLTIDSAIISLKKSQNVYKKDLLHYIDVSSSIFTAHSKLGKTVFSVSEATHSVNGFSSGSIDVIQIGGQAQVAKLFLQSCDVSVKICNLLELLVENLLSRHVSSLLFGVFRIKDLCLNLL